MPSPFFSNVSPNAMCQLWRELIMTPSSPGVTSFLQPRHGRVGITLGCRQPNVADDDGPFEPVGTSRDSPSRRNRPSVRVFTMPRFTLSTFFILPLHLLDNYDISGPTFAPKWLYAASCSMQHNSYNARVKRPQSLDDVDDEYTMSTTTNSDETDQDESLAGDKDDHYHSTGRNGVLFIPFSFSTDCLHGSLLTLAVSAVTSGFCNLRA